MWAALPNFLCFILCMPCSSSFFTTIAQNFKVEYLQILHWLICFQYQLVFHFLLIFLNVIFPSQMRRSVFLSCLDNKYEDGISLTLIVDAVETAVLAFCLKVLRYACFSSHIHCSPELLYIHLYVRKQMSDLDRLDIKSCPLPSTKSMWFLTQPTWEKVR